MAWPNSGAWTGAALQPTVRDALEALCWAVNERQLARAGTTVNVSSITRSGSTATVTTASGHGIAVGLVERVFFWGANEDEYNGLQTVTATDTDELTFTVSGSPSTPAGGTVHFRRASTAFVYDASFSEKRFPTDSDFQDLPFRKDAAAPSLSVSLTHTLGIVTARVVGHGLRAGDLVTIAGANEDGFNGIFSVLSVPPAVSVSSITRSGSTATVTTLTAHNLTTGDIVFIAGASPAAYNGAVGVTVTGANTFTYSVSGSPSTPAGGTITCKDYSRFTYESESPYPSATGSVTATANRHMVYYATWNAGVATVYCRNHGFSTNQWVHVEHDSDSNWEHWARITNTTSNTFEFAHTGSLSAQTYSASAAFWCTRPVGVRIVLQQLQTATEALVGSFVEDDSVYETPYTISAALGAGSFGSSWGSLFACPREDVGSRLEQIREVLDLLVLPRVEIGCFTTALSERSGSGTTQQNSWDDFLGNSDFSAIPSQFVGSVIQERLAGSHYESGLYTNSEHDYSWSPIPGAFVFGSLTIEEINQGDADVDSIDINDDDGDTWALSASLGTTIAAPGIVKTEKPESWFDGSAHTLGFSVDLPSAQPFSSLSVGESAGRAAYPGGTWSDVSAGFFVRELVPGTHLTYG